MSNIKQRNYLNVEKMVKAGKVVDVTEDRYYEMLGALPPERMVSNAFLVGEPMDHDRWGSPRFEIYFQTEGRFYSGGILTAADFDSMLI